jgi:hypothetical protein
MRGHSAVAMPKGRKWGGGGSGLWHKRRELGESRRSIVGVHCGRPDSYRCEWRLSACRVGTGDWGCPVWEWGGRKRNGPISVISDLIKK